MARAGRKRKQGAREANGRIRRKVCYDRGSQATADKFSVYGPDGSDAIGRAYTHGLLGENGLNLRNVARAMARAYWPMLAVGRERCALGDPAGSNDNDDVIDYEERRRRIDREKAFSDKLTAINRMGRNYRRAFDALCIDIHPDTGPAWLDAIIWASRHKREADPADLHQLELALTVLKKLAGGIDIGR